MPNHYAGGDNTSETVAEEIGPPHSQMGYHFRCVLHHLIDAHRSRGSVSCVAVTLLFNQDHRAALFEPCDKFRAKGQLDRKRATVE